MPFHIGRTSTGSESTVLIFYQELSDEGFAETVNMSAE
jgi:hypothetical protein